MGTSTEKSIQINLLEELLLEKYEPIAIVGVSLRFPGHNNDLTTFETLLSEGREGISSIPVNRWNNTLYYNEVRGTPGKNCTDQGGYIDDFDKFDAKFFSISPKEANNMDPQQRIMLELAWEALENANINPETLRGGSGSVYIGGSTIDFAKELVNVEDKALESHMATGSANSAISGRISYYLGLHGPSMTIDTACSSSLVALHLACNALRNKETDISLCGAVNLIHYPSNHIIFSQARMLAPDGRCKTFDTKADGYGRSEGAAVLVLKRLSDARKDNNNIMALVRGTAVLQDGESGGLTVPNGLAQEKVIRKTLKNAMCETKDISYIEAHGTGTPLGDPIEIQAINHIFSEYYNKENPLLVASVKTNIGHMEATAGMGSIIKTILQLQNNLIYPHLNLTQPSKHIPWDELAIEVPIKLQKWEAKNRRALINSFGFSGTIACAILEEVPKKIKLKAVSNDISTPILTISAKNEAALGQLLEKYKHAIENLEENELLSFCHISNVGRAHFNYRYAELASNKSSVIKSLNQAINHFNTQGWEISKYKSNQVVFLYTGQGAQYIGMGKALYHQYEIFRKSIDECDYLFKNYLNCSIRSIMFGEVDNAESLLSQTSYTQPALFSIEYAVTQLWFSWGVEPSLLMGHSIGEIVAATIAKLFSLSDAVKLVSHRAYLMQSVTKKGGMVAIQADFETVKNYLLGFNVSIAGINSPSQCVISGDLDELEFICKNLINDEINFTRLKVSHAFHSAHMDQILDKFKDSINDVQFNQPIIPFVSNLTGKVANYNEVMSTDYWARHIRDAVQFLNGVQTINERGKYTFIEMGPRPDLILLSKQCVSQDKHLWISSLKPNINDFKQITEGLIKFYLSDGKLDWKKINIGIKSCYFPLPLYAFDKKRYWLEAKKKAQTDYLCHPLLGKLIQSDNKNWIFISTCSPNNPAYLSDHVIREKIIFPAAGFMEMIIAMQDQVFGYTDFCIKDFYIQEPLLLNLKMETQLKTQLKFETENSYYFEIISYSEDITRRHASGYLERVSNYSVKEELLKFFQEKTEQPLTVYDNAMLYTSLLKKGFEYGEQFRNAFYVERLNSNEVWAKIINPNIDTMTFLSPTILDAVLHSIDILVEPDKVYLPVGFGEFFFLKKPKNDLQSKVKLKKSEKSDSRYDLIADVILHDSQGPVFVAKELRVKTAATINLPKEEILYSQSWKPAALRNNQNKLSTVIFIGDKNQFSNKVNDYLNLVAENLIWASSIEQIKKFLLENDCQHIVYFWKKKDYEGYSNEKSMRYETEINFKEILTLLKMLENDFFEKKIILTFVTAGGQVLPEDNVHDKRQHYPIQSTLHGFNPVLLNELPKYQNRIIDFDSLETEQLNNIKLLINELSQNNSNEHHQIAFRENNRYVLSLDNPKLLQDNFALEIADYGTFTNIQRKTIPIVEPKGDEILVKVEAAGLNFKDVINVLGILKEHAEKNKNLYKSLPLGFECSGTVIKAAGDAEFLEGDQVLVSHLGCMQRYITVSSKAAVKKPKNIRFDQAAAIPTAYITAYHALHNLAKIKRGNNILIHAGAGGVGQAAIQLAKRVGVNIIASASHLKWDFLHEQGINHIINSRESTFSDKIKLLTDGKGVDVVLNSFNKNYIQEGFNALAYHGRFIELGKIDVWKPEKASQYRPDVAYYNFDLSELPENELNELNKNILDAIVSYIEKGEIQPLPIKTFSLTQLEDAFSLLSKGENIGKVVIDFNECRTIQNALPVSIQEDRTYLITGGYGALGQYAAKWLIEHGAKHIALIGRKSVTETKLNQLKLFLDADITLLPLQGNIAKREDVERCFTIIRETSVPLGGIIHAAGIIKDAPINTQTWENFDEIFSSKVYGTWLLNEYAKNEKSKPFFVGYSSVASIVGSAGQSNYSAANAFIDNLMAWRSSHQEHGLAINWGPWSDVGMAAQLDKKKFINIEKKGVKFIEPSKAMKAFSEAIFSLKSQVLISQFNWTRYSENMVISNAYFKAVLPKVKKQPVEFSVEDIKKLPINECILHVNKLVRSKLAIALHFDTEEEIELDSHFSDLGLDSLVSVEFKNLIEKTFKIQLKASDIFDYPSIPTLSSLIVDQLVSIDNKNKSSNKKVPKGYIKKLINKVMI